MAAQPAMKAIFHLFHVEAVYLPSGMRTPIQASRTC
jgi:hypothetical protein